MLDNVPVEDLRRVIVSIHGIRSEGAWQEQFEHVFQNHFRFVKFKYGEFRHPLGAVFWIALEMWAIILGAAGVVFAWRSGWLHGWREWAIALLAWIMLGFLANALADLRRKRVVTKFAERIDCEVQNERSPHVIAHSLGSFVVGRLLQSFPERDFKHIILMGCVLRTKYDWEDLADRFEMVRNEVAGRDWVSAAAVLLRPVVPEMGAAGVRGFTQTASTQMPGFVRNFKESEFGMPWRPCLAGCPCGFGKIDSPAARVLNVPCPRLGHNDLATHRARLVWLPFLWDIPPEIYRRFVELCQDCAAAEAEKRKQDLKTKSDELRKKCWYWTRGPLETFIAERLKEETGSDPAPELVTLAVRQLWQTMSRAARHNASPRDEVCLYPLLATDVAVASALESVR